MRPWTASPPAVAALALLPALVACGGAAPSTLLQPPGGSGPDDAAAPSPEDAATAAETSGGDDVGQGSGDDSSGGGGDSGLDALPAEAAAESGGPPGVVCATATQATSCQSGETCCVVTGLGASAKCQDPSAACLAGTQVQCSSNADCPSGQVCCGTETVFETSYQSVECAASCTGADHYQLCTAPGGGVDPSAGACPSGQTCTASTLMSGYAVCK